MDAKLKLIKWHDSRGVGAQWNHVDDVKDDGICTMQSVGWVISETKSQICLAPHVGVEDHDEHQVCGEMHIPKTCIDEIIDLTEIAKRTGKVSKPRPGNKA